MLINITVFFSKHFVGTFYSLLVLLISLICCKSIECQPHLYLPTFFAEGPNICTCDSGVWCWEVWWVAATWMDTCEGGSRHNSEMLASGLCSIFGNVYTSLEAPVIWELSWRYFNFAEKETFSFLFWTNLHLYKQEQSTTKCRH